MNGTYGTVKPSVINIDEDVEIWYNYKPSRTTEDAAYETFKRYQDVSSIFTSSNATNEENKQVVLDGMYNLNLPLETFGRKGIYTIYIKPREYKCQIKDIGSLSSFTNINGIVIDSADLTISSGNDDLVGYRIDYYTDRAKDGTYRIITSNNRCEPLTMQLSSANSNANGYRFTDSGSLVFITVTPSSSPEFKANVRPFIGKVNQEIAIVNTKFDPVMIEVEIVEHDIETLSIMQEGQVLRNLDNGRMTIYNFDGEIYKQYEYSTVKDNYTTRSIAELKLDKSGNIDTSLDLEELANA